MKINLIQIKDDDLFVCTDDDGVTKKVTGAQFKALLIPPMPWDGHDGGVFHVKNATETVTFDGGPFTAWDVDGSNERSITSFSPGEELVFVTPKNCSYLFRDNSNANWDFGEYTNTSMVTLMVEMFSDCLAFNSDISNWDVSNVTNMIAMFKNDMPWLTTAFNSDISGWNVSNVGRMDNMFMSAKSFNQDLSQWCVSLIDTMPNHFDTDAIAWTEPRPVWGTCPRGENQP